MRGFIIGHPVDIGFGGSGRAMRSNQGSHQWSKSSRQNVADCSILLIFQIRRDEPNTQFVPFRPVLSLLSYLCKAPLVPKGTPVVNSLFRQRAAIENILRACIGLPALSNLSLEHRVSWRLTEFAIVMLIMIYKTRNFFKVRPGQQQCSSV